MSGNLGPELQAIQSKQFRGVPLSRDEQTAWYAHLASSGAMAEPLSRAPGQKPDVPGKNTYKTAGYGSSEADEERLSLQNAIAPPGSRVGVTGGLLPNQGNPHPAAAPAITPFEAGQRDRRDGDDYYAGLTGTQPTQSATPTNPFTPEAHSQIGARDPNARKPGAGQGTITRHQRDPHTGKKTGVNQVFGYNVGAAVSNEDGSKRDFGTTTAAMDHLDTLRAPGAAPGVQHTAQPAPAPAQPAPPVLMQPTVAATPPVQPGFGNLQTAESQRPAPTQPATAPSVEAARAAYNQRAGQVTTPGTLPTAEAVQAAPVPPGTGAGIQSMMTAQPSPRVASAFDPVPRNTGMTGYSYDPSSGKPVPGWAQKQPAGPPMFPNAIWNTKSSGLRASSKKPTQAAAAQYNPFQRQRQMLPE